MDNTSHTMTPTNTHEPTTRLHYLHLFLNLPKGSPYLQCGLGPASVVHPDLGHTHAPFGPGASFTTPFLEERSVPERPSPNIRHHLGHTGPQAVLSHFGHTRFPSITWPAPLSGAPDTDSGSIIRFHPLPRLLASSTPTTLPTTRFACSYHCPYPRYSTT